MKLTPIVKKILGNYDYENAGVLSNLAKILSHGGLEGTGRIVGLDASLGLEEGPAVSFAGYTNSYDPLYLFSIAQEARVSYVSAPIGLIEVASKKFAGIVPSVLMLNNTNSLNTDKLGPTKAITASVNDALKLGCSGVGFCIHPGSDRAFEMIEDFREISEEAKAKGLPVFLWTYPKGGFISRDGESAIDTSSYAGYMASALGANVINLKMPNKHIEQPRTKKIYKEAGIEAQKLTDRIRHVVNSSFAGRKIVCFCDEVAIDDSVFLRQAEEVKAGGANGMSISYNFLQRQKGETIALTDKLYKVFS